MEAMKDEHGRKLADITCCSCGEQFVGPELFRYYSAVCSGCRKPAASTNAQTRPLMSEDELVRAERRQMGISHL